MCDRYFREGPVNLQILKQSKLNANAAEFVFCNAEYGSKDETRAQLAKLDLEVRREEALCAAAKKGKCEATNLLFKKGADADAKNLNRKLYYSNENLNIPLHNAAQKGYIQLVDILIKHQANLNSVDKYHCTALHLAAATNYHHCVKYLLEAGADCNISTVDDDKLHIKSPYFRGSTPLHLAAHGDCVQSVEHLLSYGADYNAVNEKGHTSLYVAAKRGHYRSVMSHIRYFGYKSLADFSCVPSLDTFDTPLHFAMKYRMKDAIPYLMCATSVNCINSDGFSPLHLLCYEEGSINPSPITATERRVDVKILKDFVLSEHNVDINIANEKGQTALFFSMFESYKPNVAKFLIAYGADINIRGKSGATLLEFELSVAREHDILMYIVNCMPQLPHLESLNMKYPISENVHAEGCAIWNRSDLPKNVEFRLVRHKTHICIEMKNREIPLTVIKNSRVFGNGFELPSTMRYCLQPSLVNLVYERVGDEIQQLDCIIEENGRSGDTAHTNDQRMLEQYRRNLVILEKNLWYERKATNPLSLQHHCRFSIRKCIGPSKLKHIRTLPLPERLISYLLFEWND